jgi:hypothetical protein
LQIFVETIGVGVDADSVKMNNVEVAVAGGGVDVGEEQAVNSTNAERRMVGVLFMRITPAYFDIYATRLFGWAKTIPLQT